MPEPNKQNGISHPEDDPNRLNGLQLDMAWFERELRSRLLVIDSKLDVLLDCWNPSLQEAIGVPKIQTAVMEQRHSEMTLTLQRQNFASSGGSLEPNAGDVGELDDQLGFEQAARFQSEESKEDEDQQESNRLKKGPVVRVQSEASSSSHLRGTDVSARIAHAIPGEGVDFSRLMSNMQGNQHPCLEALHHFLEEPGSTIYASVYDQFMPCFVFASVLFTLSRSAGDLATDAWTHCIIEMCIEVIFAIEVVLRFVASPMPLKKGFLRSYHNIFDILVVLPICVRIWLTFDAPITWEQTLLLGVVPIFRLVKTLRQFRKFTLLLEAFAVATEALPVLLFIYLVILLVLTTLIYVAEPRWNLPTINSAMWMAFVSMTTVGYGDFIPQSTFGTLLVCGGIIASNLYMAIPLGILGNAFSSVWSNRDIIMLTKNVKHKMAQMGYKAEDVPLLFELYDSDGTGQLEMEEFTNMIHDMRLVMRPKRIIEMFQLLDENDVGSITSAQLVRKLFPAQYELLYSPKAAAAAAAAAEGDAGAMERLRSHDPRPMRTSVTVNNHVSGFDGEANIRYSRAGGVRASRMLARPTAALGPVEDDNED